MKNRTKFHRIRKKRNFTILDNHFIQREDLSWKAKGIMAYIFSLPDDWNINLKEVMRHATEGEAAFRSGWKELTELGYVERKPVRDDTNKKITHWETLIYENVDMKATEPHGENLHVDNQDVGNLHVDNRKLQSTYSTKDLNKQSTNNNSRNSKEYGDDSPYMDLAKRLFEHIKKRNSKQLEPNWQTWADDFRKIVELDNRDYKEVVLVLDWCQKDDFWQNNVLSPAKFRKQYDQLFLKMTKETGYGGSSYGGLEF